MMLKANSFFFLLKKIFSKCLRLLSAYYFTLFIFTSCFNWRNLSEGNY